ncbi:hypothetical protein HDU82_002342 [Entophlyctis luteolus]|nr:hypothetical protein HDU82_002342 [Entophlyctis luteolus]
MLKAEISEVHDHLGTALTSLLISYANILDEAVFNEMVTKQSCPQMLLNGDCTNEKCGRYHFQKGDEFDETRLSACIQLLCLTLTCRRHCRSAKLVYSPVNELDKKRRKLLENIVDFINPWSKPTPTNIRILQSFKTSVREKFQFYLQALLKFGWTPQKFAITRSLQTYEILFDSESVCREMSFLTRAWNYPPEMVYLKDGLFLSQNPVQVVDNVLRQSTALQSFAEQIPSEKLRDHRRNKATLLSLIEFGISLILLLECSAVILPTSWVRYIAGRFPKFDPSKFQPPNISCRLEMQKILDAISSRREEFFELRIALLRTIFMQHEPKIWNPEKAFSNVPFQSSRAMVGIPDWIQAKSPFHFVKQLIEKCSQDSLIFLCGLRPQVNQDFLWSNTAKAFAEKNVDFGYIRSHATESFLNFLGRAGKAVVLDPEVKEFIPEDEEGAEKPKKRETVGTIHAEVSDLNKEQKNRTPVLSVQHAAMKILKWYRRCIYLKNQKRKLAALKIEKWWNRVFRAPKKSYFDKVFSEVLSTVRVWRSMENTIELQNCRAYCHWYLVHAPGIIFNASEALQKIAPLCQILQQNLEDDEFDLSQKYITLQNKQKKALDNILPKAKNHRHLKISDLKDNLALVDRVTCEILEAARKHHLYTHKHDRQAHQREAAREGAARTAPKPLPPRVVVGETDEEMREVEVMTTMEKSAKKSRKSRQGW